MSKKPEPKKDQILAVHSSNVRGLRYNEDTQKLTVSFKNSPKVYEYDNVNEKEFAALKKAEETSGLSFGVQFQQTIKNKNKPFTTQQDALRRKK